MIKCKESIFGGLNGKCEEEGMCWLFGDCIFEDEVVDVFEGEDGGGEGIVGCV